MFFLAHIVPHIFSAYTQFSESRNHSACWAASADLWWFIGIEVHCAHPDKKQTFSDRFHAVGSGSFSEACPSKFRYLLYEVGQISQKLNMIGLNGLSCFNANLYEWLIKWVGHYLKECSWEPDSILENISIWLIILTIISLILYIRSANFGRRKNDKIKDCLIQNLQVPYSKIIGLDFIIN